ncbi:hypothetical protein BC826DRAFT_1103150 [Russula brevipes]|nr:hypothetical protein BC826DRAFT_1103150 [Russula brevipes]
MALLATFPLPLPDAPPSGYGWEQGDMSVVSGTTAFEEGIDQRDTFLGDARCIICGQGGSRILQRCHIVRVSEPEIWKGLKVRHWIPSQAKQHPKHEPHNGLLMCAHHRIWFDSYDFFICFFPDTRKFVFINYSGDSNLQEFHGKALALDIRDKHTPFPSLLIIHEMRVRGFHPFQPVTPTVQDPAPWQDRKTGSYDGNDSTPAQPRLPSGFMTMNVGGSSSGGRALELNENVIADILAATCAMPAWKACEMEGTGWTGTAAENIEKYVSSIGIQDST